MPKVKELRAAMYSVERIEKKDAKGRGTGEYEEVVVEHKFPYDPDDKWGMQKLQKFLNRGYTFEDPRKKAVTIGGRITDIPGDSPPKVKTELPLLPCPNCGRLCKGEFGLQRHMVTHKGIK